MALSPAEASPEAQNGAQTEAPLVLQEREGALVRLTLNRPNSLNALSEEMLAALSEQLRAIEADSSARVVVLGAAGRAFSAGHDLKQMRGHSEKDYFKTLFKACSAVMQTITAMPQPVIARVHGLATAAGCQLVAACDLAVAADDARLATSGINAGLFCSTPSVALARNVPRKAAFEMLFTGEFISAEEARRLGLVNRVAPIEYLDEVVDELAGSILDKSPVAVATGKRMFYRQLEMGLGDAYDFAGETMAENMMAEDAGEGIDAFIEKRQPKWKGR